MCLCKIGVGGRWRNGVRKGRALLVSMLCMRVRVERESLFSDEPDANQFHDDIGDGPGQGTRHVSFACGEWRQP